MNLDSPQDGWTNEENFFLKFTILNIYAKITDPIDKFIFIALHESGYSQEDIGIMLRISQEAVCKRYKNAIKRVREMKRQSIV